MKDIHCTVWTKEDKREITKKQTYDFNHDNLHRLDGPAIEYSDGSKYWYVDGKCLDTNKVESWLEDNKVDLSELEGQMAFKLRWS